MPKHDNALYLLIFVVICIATGAACYLYEGAFCQPVNGIYRPYVDLLWNASNASNLANGYPLYDSQFAGKELGYHCFLEILYACESIIFKDCAFDLYRYAAAPLTGWLFALSVSSLFDHDGRTKSDYGIYILKITSFFACACMIPFFIGNSGSVGNGFMFYILYAEGSEGFAVVAAIAAFVTLSITHIDNKPGYYLLLFLVIFAQAGTKGPIAIVTLGALAGTFVVKTIVERRISMDLMCKTITGAAATTIVLCFVVNAASNVNSDNGAVISLYYSWMNTGVHRILEPLDNRMPMKLVSFLLCILAFYGPLLIPFIMGGLNIIRRLIDGENIRFEVYYAYASVLIATVGVMFMFQVGSSHRQFLLGAIPMMVYMVWQLYENKIVKHHKVLLYYICLVLIIGIVMDVMGIVSTYNKLINFKAHDGQEVADSITKTEVEACKWIRENTPVDAVFAVDRRYIAENDCRYFYYTAFMERQAYVGGTYYHRGIGAEEIEYRETLNEMIYDSSAEELEKLLQDNGIDYVIVTNWLGTVFKPESDKITAVYENEAVAVYQYVGEL
ncbi:MAG: hypothetical protein HUJ71_09930 [Pseudobutyrivibrio sp.]|nr:hypothetical protein [Pseudobutyrivibrio sp.]